MKIAVYPGTFDPITAGHMDIILRALRVVDKLYIGVGVNSDKETVFSAVEREEMIVNELYTYGINSDKVEVTQFSGLLTEFAKKYSASITIRGIRATSDFEYEFQMACMNSILDKELQTIFLPAATKLQLVSSRLVKEVTKLGGDVGDFVSEQVKIKLKNKLK